MLRGNSPLINKWLNKKMIYRSFEPCTVVSLNSFCFNLLRIDNQVEVKSKWSSFNLGISWDTSITKPTFLFNSPLSFHSWESDVLCIWNSTGYPMIWLLSHITKFMYNVLSPCFLCGEQTVHVHSHFCCKNSDYTHLLLTATITAKTHSGKARSLIPKVP